MSVLRILFNKNILTSCSRKAPIFDLYYPIIPEMADWVQMPFETGEYNASEHKVGAIIVAASYWRDWIKGILPEGKSLMYVQLQLNIEKR